MGLVKRIEKRIERGLIWITGITTLAGAIGWMVKVGKPFTDQGWNWSESLIIGLGMACAVSLVISVALIAWRKFKPAPGPLQEPLAVPTSEQPTNVTDATGRLNPKKVDELERRLSVAQDQIAKLFEELDKRPPDLGSVVEGVSQRMLDLQRKLFTVETDAGQAIRRVESINAQLTNSTTTSWKAMDVAEASQGQLQKLFSAAEEVVRDEAALGRVRELIASLERAISEPASADVVNALRESATSLGMELGIAPHPMHRDQEGMFASEGGNGRLRYWLNYLLGIESRLSKSFAARLRDS
jgi:hypothetical protein